MSLSKREKEIIQSLGLTEGDFEPSKSYAHRVEALIRERYTVSDELALERQRFSKPQEYAEYDAFCEECKARAREETSGN